MSSLPEYSVLNMPPLERASTDMSPSSCSGNREQISPNSFYQGTFTNPLYPYGYLPTPSTPSMPGPAFGFGQMQTMMPSNGFDTGFNPALQGLNYGSAINPPPFSLPTLSPQYSASTAPMNINARPTGCVSPLDLFGALPAHQSLPGPNYTGSLGLSIGMRQEPTVDTPIELDEPEVEVEQDIIDSGDEGEVPSPVSSTESSLAYIEVEQKTMKEEKPIKKMKKIRPAGGMIPPVPVGLISPTKSKADKADTTAAAVDGAKEVKEAKKRSRTAQACEKCRIRKARCFGGNPCNRCIKRKFVCEFTPTRPRPIVKPEPVIKPKVRRHSMHTVPSAATSLPVHPLSLTQTHSHANPHGHPHAHPHSHHHSHSMTLPNFVLPAHFLAQAQNPTLMRGQPIVSGGPTLTSGMDEHLSSRFNMGLGLSLGLELDPVIDEDDLEGDSDLDMPGMSNSITDSSGSGSSGSGPASISSAAWASSLGINPENVYTPLIMGDDDIFTFSPADSSVPLGMDWGIPDPSVLGSSSSASAFPSSNSSHNQMSGGLNNFGISNNHLVGLGFDDVSQSMFMGGNEWYNNFRT